MPYKKELHQLPLPRNMWGTVLQHAHRWGDSLSRRGTRYEELLLRLTMELGGRFFLNFALTTPTLP